MVVEKLLQGVHGGKIAGGDAALDPVELESFLQSEHAAHSHLEDATLAVLQRKATALLAAIDEDDDEKAAERIDASTTSAVDLLVDHHLETLVDSITLTRSRPPGAPTARTATDEPLPETDATGALLEHEKRTATDTGHVSSSAKQSRTRALQKAQSRVHKLLAARTSQRFIGDIVGGIGSMFSRGASFLGFQTGDVRASSAANCMKKCADHSGCKYANYFGGVTGGIGINIPLLNGPNCFLYGQCSITSCYRMQPQDFSGMAQSTDVNKMCSQARLIWAEMSARKGGKSMGGGAIDLSCNGGIVPR
eukprot:g13197.t1